MIVQKSEHVMKFNAIFVKKKKNGFLRRRKHTATVERPALMLRSSFVCALRSNNFGDK